MTTNASVAKKAIIDKLKLQAGPAMPLDGVGIGYAYKPDLGHESIYGGGFRFTHTDDVAEPGGIMVSEEVEVSLYIRVIARPKTSVEETDERCRAIGQTIGAMIRLDPKLGGGMSITRIAGGAGDYEIGDDHCQSTVGYNLRVIGHVSYGE